MAAYDQQLTISAYPGILCCAMQGKIQASDYQALLERESKGERFNAKAILARAEQGHLSAVATNMDRWADFVLERALAGGGGAEVRETMTTSRQEYFYRALDNGKFQKVSKTSAVSVSEAILVEIVDELPEGAQLDTDYVMDVLTEEKGIVTEGSSVATITQTQIGMNGEGHTAKMIRIDDGSGASEDVVFIKPAATHEICEVSDEVVSSRGGDESDDEFKQGTVPSKGDESDVEWDEILADAVGDLEASTEPSLNQYGTNFQCFSGVKCYESYMSATSDCGVESRGRKYSSTDHGSTIGNDSSCCFYLSVTEGSEEKAAKIKREIASISTQQSALLGENIDFSRNGVPADIETAVAFVKHYRHSLGIAIPGILKMVFFVPEDGPAKGNETIYLCLQDSHYTRLHPID